MGPTHEKGTALIEWALLVLLIAIVAFLAVRGFGTELSSTFSTIGSSI